MRFVDGFGQNRVFCRSCWLSFPTSGVSEHSKIVWNPHSTHSAAPNRRIDGH
jgi:hypothetical protein